MDREKIQSPFELIFHRILLIRLFNLIYIHNILIYIAKRYFIAQYKNVELKWKNQFSKDFKSFSITNVYV